MRGEGALWQALEVTGFEGRQVSAAHVRSFVLSLGNLTKTDSPDARMITRFIAFPPETGRRLPAQILRNLNALTNKRWQLVASNHNLALRTFAKRLKEKGKPHKLVRIAVARKIIIVNALVAKNVKWQETKDTGAKSTFQPK